MNFKHVMIDLETMGIAPDSPITTIGAVLFDPDTGELGAGLYEKVDWIKGQDNRPMDRETVAWWLQQSDAARMELVDRDSTISLGRALDKLANFIPHGARVWGNGATFDISMLDDAYRGLNRSAPWGFRNIRDCRTIRELAEPFVDFSHFIFEGEAHNALDDAIFQAQWTSAAWEALRNNPVKESVVGIGN